MIKLYNELARAYHEMYQSIFDYKKEFKFYDKLLKKYDCKKILEIGCGGGNLAKYFIGNGYNYTGLDLSSEMLKIAKEVESREKYIQGDMRDIRINQLFDAIIITGRSFTYMTGNDDVMKALKSINKRLKKNGILVFDNFSAEVVFGDFKKKWVNDWIKYGDREYKRVSESSINLNGGWTWNWKATYYIKEGGKTRSIKDKSVLRAFTKDELRLFLRLNNFEVLDFIEEEGSGSKKTSLYIIAKKLNKLKE